MDEPKAVRVYMVGHAHIDPVWLWDWREGYEVVKATFESAVRLMRAFEDMVFVCGSAAHLAWLEQHPQLFEEVRQAVARGQLVPVLGMWVEPDANLPAGEALCRQLLEGQRYLWSRFGRPAKVAALPDTFGHPWTLPQILRQAGLEAFLFMRPAPHEKGLPAETFWWEAPDGSRVLAHRLTHYHSPPDGLAGTLAESLARRPPDQRVWVFFYGVGNHGGGPTRALLEEIARLDADPAWPRLVHGSPEAFFAELRTGHWPVVRDELQYHARGAYSALSAVKALNRQAEAELLAAEKLAVLGQAVGLPYPREELRRAWRSLLFNQFHDTLAGTAIWESYEDVAHELGEALAIAARVQHRSLERLADQVTTSRHGGAQDVFRYRSGPEGKWVDLGDGVPVIVFNPSPFVRREVVFVEVSDWAASACRVVDDRDEEVPSQFVRPSAVVAGWRRKVAFLAEVPGLGYRVYRLLAERPRDQAPVEVDAARGRAETPSVRLEVDEGSLVRIFDKRLGRELLSGPVAAEVLADPGDTWSHGIAAYRDTVGRMRGVELAVEEPPGPVLTVLRLTSVWGSSRLVQRLRVYRDLPEVEVGCELVWQEERKILKLAFPLAVPTPRVRYEIPYGWIERAADGTEQPGQRWVDLVGPDGGGVALLNDGRYGFDCHEGVLRMTCARSAVYAHHDPRTLGDEPYRYQDQGTLRWRWLLAAHGPGEESRVRHLAEALQRPLFAVREWAHPGRLPAKAALFTLEPEGRVELGALKAAEDGEGYIVRLHEPCGSPARVRLRSTLLGVDAEVELGPFALRTFRLGPGGAEAVDIVERPAGEGA